MPSSESEGRAERWLEGLREHEDRRLESHESAAGAEPSPLRLERYEIGDPLGRGAASTVYRAFDRELNRRAAIKVLREPLGMEASVRERFLREAKVMAAIPHANVVGVYDAGASNDLLYLVLELVDGPPLSILWSGTAVDVKARARLVEKAARGVAASHAMGVVHRDLKPANILVSKAGEPKVGDFGLAHVIGSDVKLTRTGAVLGTPAYMAPEQVAGRTEDISARTDVYALGAILYEGVTGRTPHLADSVTELFGKITGSEPPAPSSLNPSVSRDLQTVILKALEKDPSQRYADASAFADDLARSIAGEPVQARPPGTLRRIHRWAGRRRLGLGAASLLVLVAAALGAVALVQGRRSAAESEARRILDGIRHELDAVEASWRIEASSPREGRETAERERRRVEDAEKVAPGLAATRILLGRAWEILGWDDRAEKAWREAIAIDPKSGEARYRLARLLMRKAYLMTLQLEEGEREGWRPEAGRLATEGAAELQAALDLDYGEPLQKRLASLLSRHILLMSGKPVFTRGEAEPIVADLDRALLEFRGRPGAEEFYWLKSIIGLPEDQFTAADEAIRRRPHFPVARLRRGQLHMDGRRFEAARADLSAAIEANPRLSQAWANRSVVAAMEEKFDDGLADLDELARIDPSNPDLPKLRSHMFANRALFRTAKGEPDAALVDWNEALRLCPRLQAGHRQRGQLQREMGNIEAAKKDFRSAIEIDPRDGDAWLNLGLIFSREGDRPGAIKAVRTSLEAAPPEWPSRKLAEQILAELLK